MNKSFDDEERLYRAIRPHTTFPNHWKKNGKLSSAALKDAKGLSVERGAYRDVDVIAQQMAERRFKGTLASLAVGECRQVDAIVKYLPGSSKYHSEIHGSDTVKILSDAQAKKLAMLAHIERKLDTPSVKNP